MGLPCSAVMTVARYSRRSTIRAATLRRRSARVCGEVAAQPGKAAAAASMAARVSATPPSAICLKVSPVAGLVTGKVAPLAAGCHCPLMSKRCSVLSIAGPIISAKLTVVCIILLHSLHNFSREIIKNLNDPLLQFLPLGTGQRVIYHIGHIKQAHAPCQARC